MEEKSMNCCPKCRFFSSGVDVVCDYVYDDRGVKVKPLGTNFVCLYDSHKIISWYEKCPMNKESKNESR